MNKEYILKKFKEAIVRDRIIGELRITEITSLLQEAKSNEVVFYHLKKDSSSVQLFFDRLKKASPGLVVIDHDVAIGTDHSYIVIKSDMMESVIETFLDEIYPMSKPSPKLVGVTGTNGKTSTVNFATMISALMGIPAISIGTLGIRDHQKELDLKIENTTPGLIEFRKALSRYGKGHRSFFAEVSSHALDQNRLGKLTLDLAAWTSFSQDHLDYHKSMENYFQAKCKIFTEKLKSGGVMIVPEGNDLYEQIKKENKRADIEIIQAKTLKERGFKDYPDAFRVRFIRKNFEVALEICERLYGKTPQFFWNDIELPRGRFNLIKVKKSWVVIDYAHTPDALENILTAARDSFPGQKIISLFGCGGNRDRKKRPLMGEIAEKLSDRVVVTSDNPRFEVPSEIIEEILVGIKNRKAVTINENREEAILKALDELIEGDILIIAGKGHEEYQEIKGEKYPFSDFLVVEKYLKGKP